MKKELTIRKWQQTVRLVTICLCLIVPVLAFGAISPTKPSGSGTSSDPYLISNANELYWFARLVNGTGSESQNTSACAKLTANITVNPPVLDPNGNLLPTTYSYTVWEPIGYHNSNSDYARFTGTIDGNGKTISGLYLNDTSRSYIGFCGYGGGTITNLGIVDSYFKANQYVGVVYGYNEGTVSQCYSKGTASGTDGIGGVCGSTAFGNVENSYNQGKVVGTGSYVGGVVGANQYGKISNCYSAGTVSGSTTNRGGVCGYNSGTIKNCYYDKSKCSSGGIANADVASQAEGKSSSIFLSGEVAYKLQGSQSSAIWGQTISSDIYPTLGGKKVYYGYINCTDIAYSNNETSDTPKHSYDNGFCTVCGALQPAEVVSSSNHPELMSTHPGYYTIGNAGQLYWYANKVNNDRQASIDAVLTANINVNNRVLNDNFEFSCDASELRVWNPIGYHTETGYVKYNGVFDGNNYYINGLYFDNTNTDYVGFIGYYGGTVSNLAVINSVLKGGSNVGGICGWGDGTITNCYYYGTVQGSSNVGGLCGQNLNTLSVINNSFFAGKISGTSNVGSIIGKSNGIVANCYYDSTKSAVGGICGADISGKAEGKTFEQFKSGEVAYLLSLGCTIDGEKYDGNSWGQILGLLDYPFLGSRKVYFGYEEGTCNAVYSNSPLNTTPTHSFDYKGFCTACGAYKPAEIISASHHPEMCEKHNGYYAIECPGNLYWLAEQVNAGNTAINAVLASNIVINGTLEYDETDANNALQWTPIGYYNSANDKLLYSGNFDGNGKTIRGLCIIDTSCNYVGLFGANGGKIENLGIVESHIKGNKYVGSICGYNLGGIITNCYNHCDINGTDYVGGISGSTTSSISNCYNIGLIQADTANKSAICSDYGSGTITNCYCTYEYSKDKNNEGVTKFEGALEFKNGKVAYLLQGNQSTHVWGQKIDTDKYPVIFGDRVYYGYDCAGLKYSNEELPTTQPDHSYNIHGFCDMCHAHQEAKPVSETHHPELLKTHSGYYAIENGGQLCWFAESKDGSANAVLTDDVYINDFDISSSGDFSKYRNQWVQISSFSGKFDGNNHIISGLYMPSAYSKNGMFKTITGEVSNFALKNFSISGWDNSSAICSINQGTIRNCSTQGHLSVISDNTDYCSGICSINYGTIADCTSGTIIEGKSKPDYTGAICSVNYGTVDNCKNNVSVQGGLYVGGIVGDNEGTIINCVSSYPAAGDNCVGGICGHNKSVVSNCKNTDIVDSMTNAGGICGHNEGDILYCSNQKSVTSPNGSGGICGLNSGKISHCTNYSGTLSSLKNAGGICAENLTSGTIEYCSAAGEIESLDIKTPIVNSAGVCGLNRGTILNCCSSVNIEGNDCVGGIVGENKAGIIANCYYKGIINNGDTNVGSICGINNATIAYCYYDSDRESTEACPNNNLAENVVGKSSKAFRSGEVAYTLSQGGTITANGKTTTFDGDYWGQHLGADEYPVIDSGNKVLRAEKEADNSYWTTFSDLTSDSELSVPSGNSLKVCNATVSAGKLTLTSRYNSQVAAGEGVLAKTDCQYLSAMPLVDTSLIGEDAELNNLVATPATAQTITADNGYCFYDLAFDNSGANLAFYLGQAKDANGNVTSSDGSKLSVMPGKAYLKVARTNAVDPTTQAPAHVLAFPDNIGTSGVDSITIDNGSARFEKDAIYDLWGRKVKNPTKGIYIRNGKKIIIR